MQCMHVTHTILYIHPLRVLAGHAEGADRRSISRRVGAAAAVLAVILVRHRFLTRELAGGAVDAVRGSVLVIGKYKANAGENPASTRPMPVKIVLATTARQVLPGSWGSLGVCLSGLS
jgi:hypothetical protein